MDFVDVIILVFIGFGGIIGFRRGAIKELVSGVGFILITFLSFVLKNPLSILLYENLPFFKFGGIIKGVTVLNIFLYEFIAFLLIFFVLMFLWKVVLFASSIIQKILNMTIILGLPSKIIGFLFGLIEFYLISFIIIYILTLPIFSVKSVINSKVGSYILNDTPLVSDTVKNSTGYIDDFVDLKDKYLYTQSADQFNYETLDLFLKYDIVTVDSVKKLKEKNKLDIENIDDLIKKYE